MRNKVTTKVATVELVSLDSLPQGALATLDGTVVLRTATGAVRLSDGDTWTFGKGSRLEGDTSIFSKSTAKAGLDIKVRPFRAGDQITLNVE